MAKKTFLPDVDLMRYYGASVLDGIAHWIDAAEMIDDARLRWFRREDGPMTEQEWLTSNDPARMLRWLTNGARYMPGGSPHNPGVTDRKLCLFAKAVEPSFEQWEKLDYQGEIGWAETARRLVSSYQTTTPTTCPIDKCAALLRDIFGNPFQPMSSKESVKVADVDDWKETSRGSKGFAAIAAKSGALFVKRPASWLTPTVINIAQAIHDERAFDRMPVLADALEEAGCREEAILRHCRLESYCDVREVGNAKVWNGGFMTPHVRGCHVIDLILGKE